MSFLRYLSRKLYGLPACDSEQLISAKKYNPPSPYNASYSGSYDLHTKEMDPFMFGAIAPKNNDMDLLDGHQLEQKAQDVYSMYSNSK